jgi:hypothetical protein
MVIYLYWNLRSVSIFIIIRSTIFLFTWYLRYLYVYLFNLKYIFVLIYKLRDGELVRLQGKAISFELHLILNFTKVSSIPSNTMYIFLKLGKVIIFYLITYIIRCIFSFLLAYKILHRTICIEQMRKPIIVFFYSK